MAALANRLGRLVQSTFDLGTQSQWIPVETVQERNSTRLKSVDFFQCQASSIKAAEDGAPTFGAQVEGQQGTG